MDVTAQSGQKRKGTKMNKPATFPAVITIGKAFADDHWDRDCGQTDKILATTKTTYTVELDESGWVDLYSDADYYWEITTGRDPEPGLRLIGLAAKRVKDKMDKYVEKAGA